MNTYEHLDFNFFLKLVFPGAPRCMHLPSLYNKHIVTFPLFLESSSTVLPAISQTSSFLPLSEEQSASGAASGCKGLAAQLQLWAGLSASFGQQLPCLLFCVVYEFHFI